MSPRDKIARVSRCLFEKPDLPFEEIRKRRLFAFLLVPGTGIMFSFGLSHLLHGNYAEGLLDCIYGLWLAASLALFRFVKRGQALYRLNAAFLGLVFVLFAVKGSVGGNRMMWAFSFPLIAFYTLGKLEGLAWTSGILGVLAAVMYAPARVPAYAYAPEFKLRFCAAFFLVSAFSYIYESVREHSQKSLENERNKLRAETAKLASTSATVQEMNAELVREHAALRASESALREREEYLATTLDSIGDGVIATDAENCIVRMNPVAELLTGWNLAEAKSRPLGEVFTLVDDETGHAISNPAEEALREGAVVALASHAALVARNGTRRSVADSAAPIRDASGQIRGVILVFRDVGEEKKAQQALSRARSQLEFSARMASVGTLAAGVGHEINNPLACVIANLAFVASELTAVSKDLPPGRLREMAETISEARDGAERIRRIVRDLKIFSRASDEHRGPVDLERVVEWSITMLRNQIRHRARLVKEFGNAPVAHGNESRLGQVLVNLLINAVQAIPEGNVEKNEIRIVTRADERGWSVVEVRDTGAGIAPEIQRKIFDPFFTTKDVGVGTGIGLTICHRIVTDLGGEISVESEPGKGACFRVALAPARLDASDGARHPTALVKSAPEGRRGRVLIIDDEPMAANALRRSLAPEHDVAITTRATEALERLGKGERFDLIVCDLMMPEMTGMDLHARLLELRPADADRMVFVTGGAFTHRAREFLDRVPNQRMEKPFDPQALLALVRDRLATEA